MPVKSKTAVRTTHHNCKKGSELTFAALRKCQNPTFLEIPNTTVFGAGVLGLRFWEMANGGMLSPIDFEIRQQKLNKAGV